MLSNICLNVCSQNDTNQPKSTVELGHTSWMTVVTATDRPTSVRNRCVIDVVGDVFVLSIGFRIFCWYRFFCHRTESDLL